MSDRGGYLVILTRLRDMYPSHQDSHQPLSSHEYQNVSHMDISSLTMVWICKIAQLHCPAVSMRFEVSRLFSRHTIDLQIKLFLRSLSLHLLHVCCVLKLIAHCFCCLLHYIYWVLCTALVIYYFSVQFWSRNFIASSSSNSNVCFQLAAELSLWSKKWEKQFKLNRPENVFIIFLMAARMLSRLSESALMTREREQRELVGWDDKF